MVVENVCHCSGSSANPSDGPHGSQSRGTRTRRFIADGVQVVRRSLFVKWSVRAWSASDGLSPDCDAARIHSPALGAPIQGPERTRAGGGEPILRGA